MKKREDTKFMPRNPIELATGRARGFDGKTYRRFDRVGVNRWMPTQHGGEWMEVDKKGDPL